MMQKLFCLISALLTTFLLQSFASQQIAYAEVRPEAATVLTGRVIPAFIGGAYDPSEAFKQLAGLPIYVFAYDAFQGSNQVKGNLAIRTQIRADGSFQAQGLFSGSHYGVYFPFKGYDENGDGNYDTVVRTDCRSDINDTQPHCKGTYVGGFLKAEGVYFRWPESAANPAQDDKILDVFSYKQNDVRGLNNGADVIVQSQIPCDTSKCSKEFEDVVVEHVFATSTTRVDIDNSINVFPVIPVKVVKVNVGTGGLTEPISYEVVAQRIAQLGASPGGGQEMVRVESPVIKGRTNPGQPDPANSNTSLSTFQAFAPPGLYAITVWRTDSDSATYKDWSPTEPLNALRHGFAVNLTDLDWREAFGKKHKISPQDGWLIVWGVITDENGFLQSNYQNPGVATAPRNYEVGIFSETNLPFVAKTETEKGFYTVGGAGSTPEVSTYGVYAYFQDPNLGGDIFYLNDQTHTYINKNTFQKNPKNVADIGRDVIRSTDGATRLDLVAAQDDKDPTTGNPTQNTTGFQSGIVLDVTYNGQPVRNADITVIHATPDGGPITAAKTPYGTNVNGRIHIPHQHLINDSDVNSFAIAVESGGRFGAVAVQDYQKDTDGNPSNGNQGDYREYTVSAGNAVELSTVIRQPKPYKILGKIPVPLSIVQAQNYQQTTVTGTLQNSENLKGVQVYVKRVLKTGDDPTCFERKADGNFSEDGTCFFKWTIPNKEFHINFQVPLSAEEVGASLENSLCQPDFNYPPGSVCYEVRKKMGQIMASGISTDAYVLEVKGTMVDKDGVEKVYSADYRLVVDDKGSVSPTSVTLNLSIDCSEVEGGEGNLFQKAIATVVNRSACNFVQFVGNKAQGLIGDFQRQFLQIRPLTDAPGIIEAWNLMRALTNVFFILFLIIIGFATIFRWDPKTWSLGLLLPRLIVAVVLANFSLLIVQLLLDVNNLLTHAIFNMGGDILAATKTAAGKEIIAAGSVGGWATAITTALGISIAYSLLSSLGSTIALGAATGGLAFIPVLISLAGFSLTIFIFLLGLFLLWFMRYAVIWIATVIAPLIFALSTFPSLENFRKLWFDTLFPFTLMQTVTAIIFTIGLFLLTVAGGTGTVFTDVFTILTALFVLGAALKAPQFTTGLFKGLVSNKAMGAFGEAAGKWKQGYLKDTLTVEGVSTALGRARAEAAAGTGVRGALGRIPGAALFRGVTRGMTGRSAAEVERLKGVQEGIKAAGETRTQQEAVEDEAKSLQQQQRVNRIVRSESPRSKPARQKDIKQLSTIPNFALDTDRIHGIDASGNIRQGASISVEDYRNIFSGGRKDEGLAKLHALKAQSPGEWAQNFAVIKRREPQATPTPSP